MDLELFLSLDLDTVVHALGGVALVLARLVVVGVFAVAAFPDVLAGTFLFFHLCLCVGVDALLRQRDARIQLVGRLQPAIGAARLDSDEMLSWLMIKIYGSYTPQLLARLLEMNPGIADPDHIDVGQRIVFPAVPVTITKQYAGNWWVSIADTDDFEKACQEVFDFIETEEYHKKNDLCHLTA